jgi:hypothetical protein
MNTQSGLCGGTGRHDGNVKELERKTMTILVIRIDFIARHCPVTGAPRANQV